jgi:hypothetical protein
MPFLNDLERYSGIVIAVNEYLGLNFTCAEDQRLPSGLCQYNTGFFNITLHI